MKHDQFFVQIVFLKMTSKNKSKKKKSKKSSGFAKIATITTKSLSSAITNFKKNQEVSRQFSNNPVKFLEMSRKC